MSTSFCLKIKCFFAVHLWCIYQSHQGHSNSYSPGVGAHTLELSRATCFTWCYQRHTGSRRQYNETLSGFDGLRLRLSSWHWSSWASWGFVLVAALMLEICICFDMLRVWHKCLKTATTSPERLSSGRETTVYKLSQHFYIFFVSSIYYYYHYRCYYHWNSYW